MDILQRLQKWGPVAVAIVCGVILLFGLGNTLHKDILVAPSADPGGKGRLHHHMKNITRIGGSAPDVSRAIDRAVNLSAPDSVGGRAEAGGSVAWQTEFALAYERSELPRHAIIVASGGTEGMAWALPGLYWAVYSGCPVFFVDDDVSWRAARDSAAALGVPVYVLGPEEIIPEEKLEALREVAPVHRVADSDIHRHAVAIAEYRDESTGFGWGRTYNARNGYFHYVLAAPAEWEQAMAAIRLARTNAATFLFTGDDGGVPAATDRYVWAQRADWFVTPAEGPFRHFWVVGDRLSYAAQSRLDLSIEKAPYASMGPVALGPMEALLLVFIALGVCGGVFVLLHGVRLLPEVPLAMRLAWAYTATLLPILGVILYLAAYRRPRADGDGGMVSWLRPPSIQAAAATAMGFGYGAPLMIAIGFGFLWFGFPLFFGEWADSAAYLAGAGMPIMMAGMFFGAVLIAWPLVQWPMKAMMAHDPAKAARMALVVTTISMLAVSLGMMTTSWWMLMLHIPMMPKEDELLFFGAMWLASSVGFLVAWPLNWPMVRASMKSGGM